MKGYKTEVLLYVTAWTAETLMIKYLFGVESWLISILLVITVGSGVVWAVKHLPDLLD